MVIKNEFFFPSSDGINKLHCMEWLPDSALPRGIIQIIHGIGEHIARYGHFAEYMAENGFIVFGCSLLGHGLTASSADDFGFFAQVDGWNTVVHDIRSLHLAKSEKYPELPYFILGHSMGSFIARTYLTMRPAHLDGCILSGTAHPSAPLLKAGALAMQLECRKNGKRQPAKKLDLLSFFTYNLHFSPVRTEYDWISRDSAVVDAFISDPLCSPVFTCGMFSDMLEGLKYITNPRNLKNLQSDLPIYFFSGTDDPVGNYGHGVMDAYFSLVEAGCEDVSIKLYPHGRHEMLNDICRDRVYRDIQDWIDYKLKIKERYHGNY